MSTPSPAATITADDGIVTITLERRLRGAPNTVWSALTTTERLVEWLPYPRVEVLEDGTIQGSTPSPGGQSCVAVATRLRRPYEAEFEGRLGDGRFAIVAVHLADPADRSAHTDLTLQVRQFSTSHPAYDAAVTHTFVDRLEASLDGTPVPFVDLRVTELARFYLTAGRVGQAAHAG